MGSGSDTRRILVARGLRAFGDGFVALLVPIYLLELGFSPLAIGAIVTSTLVGTALLTLWAGMVANRYSVRLLLLASAALMAATGIGFAATTAFWPLLLIAFVGTMNPTSGDASIFLPLENAALFGMDSFGTGFLVQSLLALWLYQRFQISMTTAASILFWTGICSAVSYLVAVPIAERIGLINTMVFTHLPSNVLLALVPFAPDLPIAIALLLARSALSQMDVPTRSSYAMAVVAPAGRPAAAGAPPGPKTFSRAAGALISGYLLPPSGLGRPPLSRGAVEG